MSCWVVPSLAADLWRIPLSDVMQRIADGLVPAKQEEGFTFVDVAPDGPKIQPVRLPRELRPPTFTTLSPAELAALSSEDEVVLVAPIEATPAEAVPAEPVTANEFEAPEEILMLADRDPEDSGAVETESAKLGDWRNARRQAGRLRIPPPRRLSA